MVNLLQPVYRLHSNHWLHRNRTIERKLFHLWSMQMCHDRDDTVHPTTVMCPVMIVPAHHLHAVHCANSWLCRYYKCQSKTKMFSFREGSSLKSCRPKITLGNGGSFEWCTATIWNPFLCDANRTWWNHLPSDTSQLPDHPGSLAVVSHHAQHPI